MPSLCSLSTFAPSLRRVSRWKSIGRPPMLQPPSAGMNASPRRCSSGPENRIGMRDEPDSVSTSPRRRVARWWRRSSPRRSRRPRSRPRRAGAAGRTPRARRGFPERSSARMCRGQQCGDHGLAYEVLRAAHLDGAVPAACRLRRAECRSYCQTRSTSFDSLLDQAQKTLLLSLP